MPVACLGCDNWNAFRCCQKPHGIGKIFLDICELGKSSSSGVIEMEARQQWAEEGGEGEGSMIVTVNYSSLLLKSGADLYNGNSKKHEHA